MNLGDVSVKKFGNETDFLIKFENNDNKNVIEEIKIMQNFNYLSYRINLNTISTIFGNCCFIIFSLPATI